MQIVIYTQRVENVADYGERRDCADQKIAAFIRSCGYLPIAVPNQPMIAEEIINELKPAGIIFTGGNSLVSYGGDASERDQTEKKMLDIALEKKIPVYGFCRGMQMILSYFGNILENVEGHAAVYHNISGETGDISVNSYHRQACRKVNDPLHILAMAEDGVIEAVDYREKNILATMWHPERENPFRESDIKRVQQLFRGENEMRVIILAAGQGTRLRPLTDHCPKCMVQINGKSIIRRQVEIMHACGIENDNITVISGYRSDVLRKEFQDTGIQFLVNPEYETTNMVCSLMCGKAVIENADDVLISYGDIVYEEHVLRKILNSDENISVVTDDGWYDYWSERCENPLDDAETLILDENDHLIEIGQKTTELSKVQSQYIGLMRFKNNGVKEMLELAREAERRSLAGEKLWKTERTYSKMYMTDLLQGLIDSGSRLKAVRIQRDWYEIDDEGDLKIAEKYLK